MTDNEKLLLWQGWKNHTTLGWCRPPGKDGLWFAEITVPDYPNNDAAAMSLLDTLVEKGYEYNLCGNTRKVDLRIYKDDVGVCMSIKPTRRAAVVAAVLELIERVDI